MSAKESSRMSEKDIPKFVLCPPSVGEDDFEKVNRKLRMEFGEDVDISLWRYVNW